MADILIRGYKAKEQIEEIIQAARYVMNNSMVGSGLEIIELPPHGDLIDRDGLCADLVSNHPVVIYAKNAPVIVPASEEVKP